MSLALDLPKSPAQPPSAPAPSGRARLTKRQKAAIVVRVLLAEGAKISLDDLPGELQVELARQMTEMRFVDRTTLAAVVDEFIAEIEEIGLSFPGGIEGAITMLDGAISAETASRLRKQAGLAIGDDPWVRIAEFEVERLAAVIVQESVEVGAVMLSKLRVGKAAEVLGQLSGDRARRIAYAVSQTGAVAPSMVRKIGHAVLQQLSARPETAFEEGPSERVGAILNFSPSATRDEVLAGLDETDAGFAAKVRKSIFTFAHIPARIVARDVPRIARDIAQETFARIVSGATGDEARAAEFMLENMSKRLADAIREEAAEISVKPKDVEEAMSAVVLRIREMEGEGELTLIVEDDE